ncbi:hypothetical protein DSO57_1002510 [Entomophthora muscae]|uniref:Uncharacterized protein n=1 Tax=Entomophthora muscae TaxID=34485 RepID=A0ACC2SM66_9FUNG|nr:hypothetical protein DSO57_1002510 [Entomophthora muscae]
MKAVMSTEMDQWEWAAKENTATGHACWTYPINHTDIHLANVQKGLLPPPCSSIWFVKPTYMTEYIFEQLKQSALAASSQSTIPASLTPHQYQATHLPTLTPKPPPIPSPLPLMPSLLQAQMKATYILLIPSPLVI